MWRSASVTVSGIILSRLSEKFLCPNALRCFGPQELNMAAEVVALACALALSCAMALACALVCGVIAHRLLLLLVLLLLPMFVSCV